MTNEEVRKALIKAHAGFNEVKCPICNKAVATNSDVDTIVYVKSKRDKQHRFYHKKCVENQWKSGDGK